MVVKTVERDRPSTCSVDGGEWFARAISIYNYYYIIQPVNSDHEFLIACFGTPNGM